MLPNLGRLDLRPLKPDWGWEDADDGVIDGAFKGTPDELLPIMQTYFKRGTVRKKTFPTGAGYLITDGIGRQVIIRPAKGHKDASVIAINPDPAGRKNFQLAVDTCQKAGWEPQEPTAPSERMTTVSCEATVTQRRWNLAMHPLFTAGWKATMVRQSEMQILRKGGVDIQFQMDQKKVVILWNR